MTSREPAPPVEVDGRAVTVTNLDKVLYPEAGTTKGDVIDYYRRVAPWFVPHAAWRPATRKRWVNGVGTARLPGYAFFHKNLQHAPDWVATATIEHSTDKASYPLVNDAATLVYLAQLAALELHVPQWRYSLALTPQPPDRLILDLDPGEGAGIDHCVEVALIIKEILDGVGLKSVPVTSGSKGIHVYAGLEGVSTQGASELAKQLAVALETAHPGLVVASMKKVAREGRVLLDWSQNNAAKTTVAPYSLRGRLRPTVAAPRTWDEIAPGLRQLEYPEVLERLASIGDPLAVLLPDGARSGPPPHRVSHAPAPAPAPAPAELPLIEPMLATPGTQEELLRNEWHYEVKWDGYRCLASVSGGRLRLASRKGIDLTSDYPELGELTTLVGGHAAIIDGEIVALGPDRRSHFELLQGHGRGSAPAHFMAFDLLVLDGESLLGRPYLERRTALEALLALDGRHVHVPATFGDDREFAFATSTELRLEGVIAKRATSTYAPGRRSRAWLKFKNVRHQDVVVVGWSGGDGRRADGVGSLLLAVRDDTGALAYCGRVGSGFTERGLAEALDLLRPLGRPTPALGGIPREDARLAHWVEPTLVGEVAFTEWTARGHLRHPVWRGWRPDVDSAGVRRD